MIRHNEQFHLKNSRTTYWPTKSPKANISPNQLIPDSNTVKNSVIESDHDTDTFNFDEQCVKNCRSLLIF